MNLKKLSVFTFILFLISIVVFFNENKRGTDLLEGSDYIKGIDGRKIQKIIISSEGDKKIIIKQDGGKVVLENYKSYPVAPEKFNDLIYSIAKIQVKEKISSSADKKELERFELDDKTKKYQIEIFDNENKNTVSFRVGKDYKNKGNYIYKIGKKEIYLSNEAIRFNTSYKDFINTNLLDLKAAEIVQINIDTGKKIELFRDSDNLALKKPKVKQYKQEKVDAYIDTFSNINFEDFFRHSDEKTSGLKFNSSVELITRDKITYVIDLANGENNYYIKLKAITNDSPKQIVVNKDDNKEKLQEIENIIYAQSRAQKFNIEKATWIYKVSKSTYEKIAVRLKYFL